MGLFKNRIRSIVGENSGFWESAGNLIYYFANPEFYRKLWSKIWKQLTTKVPKYTTWVQMQDSDILINTSNIHFTIICATSKKVSQTYSNITFLNRNESLNIDATSYIIWLDEDDILDPNACAVLAQAIQQTGASIITFDYDFLENGIRCAPQFLPSWSPVALAYSNYIQNAVCVKCDSLCDFQQGFSSPVAFYNKIKQVDVDIRKTNRVQKVLLSKKKEEIIVEKPTTIMQQPLVSIIIPTFNKTHLVKQCIDSIINHSTYTNYEIVLVDNKSTEPELTDLIHQYQSLLKQNFIHLSADYAFNFSQLMNDGVNKSKGEYIVLLNNDTEIITPEWIEQLLAIAVRSDVGAVGAKLLYPDNSIQHAGIVLNNEVVSKHIYIGKKQYAEVYQNALNSIKQYSAITAACLMINRNKYLEVNGFDVRYKVEFNDIDFCLRLLERGYYNVYTPFVQVYHYESSSRQHPMSTKKSKDTYSQERAQLSKQWEFYIEDDPFWHPNINTFRL